jgi:hypothetical protein
MVVCWVRVFFVGFADVHHQPIEGGEDLCLTPPGPLTFLYESEEPVL